MPHKKHVFLSYSRQDSHIVERVRYTLEKAGIPVWLDTKQLIPGTPNWEQAITEAIDEAFALVLVASPDAKSSPYVQGEIAFAEANHIPIFIIWARGDNWSRTVPIHMIRSQYVDARQENYQVALEQLIDQLSKLVDLSDTLKSDDKANEFVTNIPEGSIEIGLPDNQILYVDVTGVRNINQIIMRAYHGASQFVPPYSYGVDWVLAQKVLKPDWEPNYPVMRAALGWDYFASLKQGKSVGNPSHFGEKDTAYVGAIAGTRWQVLLRDSMKLFAISGVRRDVLFPGLVPPAYCTDAPNVILTRIDQLRNHQGDFINYIKRVTGRELVLRSVKSFKSDQYMESFDLFILQDIYNSYPQMHNQVIEFFRK